MGRPAVVGTPTSTIRTLAGTTIVATKPTGLADGDVLVVAIREQSALTTDYSSSGFVRRASAFDAGVTSARRVTSVFTKTITSASGEPSSYTFTNAQTGNRCIAVAFIVRGANASTPVDVATSTYSGTLLSSTGVRAAALTVSAADSLAVFVGAAEFASPNGHTPSSTPSGMTVILAVTTDASTAVSRTYMWTGQQDVDAGSTGNKDLVWSGTPATNTPAAEMIVFGPGLDPLTGDLSATAAFTASVAPAPSGNIAASAAFTATVASAVTGTVSASAAFTAVLPATTGQIASGQVTWFTDTELIGGWILAAGASCRMAVSSSPTMTSPVYSSTLTPSGAGWVTGKVASLAPDTDYWVGLEIDGALQTDRVVQASTLPTPGTPKSFTILAGSCQVTGSNHASLTQMASEDAEYLLHMGDLHYANATTVGAWRAAVVSSLSSAGQRALNAAMPMQWTWDNHDGVGGQSGDGTYAAWPDVMAAYRELTLDLPATDTVNRTWVHGRVRFIRTDQWSVKSPNGESESPAKTMMGATQKAWFFATLTAATEPIIVWVSGWPGSKTGGRWTTHTTESNEIETWITSRPTIQKRMIMLGGDSHDIRADNGSRAASFAGIPTLSASPIDQTGDPFDTTGWTIGQIDRESGRGYYSRVEIDDATTAIKLRWSAVRDDGTVMLTWERAYTTGDTSVTAAVSASALPCMAQAGTITATSALTATAMPRVAADGSVTALATLTAAQAPAVTAGLTATASLSAMVSSDGGTSAVTGTVEADAELAGAAVVAVAAVINAAATVTAVSTGRHATTGTLTAAGSIAAQIVARYILAADLAATTQLSATATDASGYRDITVVYFREVARPVRFREVARPTRFREASP